MTRSRILNDYASYRWLQHANMLLQERMVKDMVLTYLARRHGSRAVKRHLPKIYRILARADVDASKAAREYYYTEYRSREGAAQ